MKSRLLLLFCVLGMCALPSHAVADPKVIVTVIRHFFGDTNCTPNSSGTKICADMVVEPHGLEVLAIREGGNRAGLTASAACGAIKTLIITRAAILYPTVSLTAAEVVVQGCLQ